MGRLRRWLGKDHAVPQVFVEPRYVEDGVIRIDPMDRLRCDTPRNPPDRARQ